MTQNSQSSLEDGEILDSSIEEDGQISNRSTKTFNQWHSWQSKYESRLNFSTNLDYSLEEGELMPTQIQNRMSALHSTPIEYGNRKRPAEETLINMSKIFKRDVSKVVLESCSVKLCHQSVTHLMPESVKVNNNDSKKRLADEEHENKAKKLRINETEEETAVLSLDQNDRSSEVHLAETSTICPNIAHTATTIIEPIDTVQVDCDSIPVLEVSDQRIDSTEKSNKSMSNPENAEPNREAQVGTLPSPSSELKNQLDREKQMQIVPYNPVKNIFIPKVLHSNGVQCQSFSSKQPMFTVKFICDGLYKIFLLSQQIEFPIAIEPVEHEKDKEELSTENATSQDLFSQTLSPLLTDPSVKNVSPSTERVADSKSPVLCPATSISKPKTAQVVQPATTTDEQVILGDTITDSQFAAALNAVTNAQSLPQKRSFATVEVDEILSKRQILPPVPSNSVHPPSATLDVERMLINEQPGPSALVTETPPTFLLIKQLHDKSEINQKVMIQGIVTFHKFSCTPPKHRLKVEDVTGAVEVRYFEQRDTIEFRNDLKRLLRYEPDNILVINFVKSQLERVTNFPFATKVFVIGERQQKYIHAWVVRHCVDNEELIFKKEILKRNQTLIKT